MENGSNELGLLSRDNEILTSLNTKLERENRCVRVIKLRCVKVFAHFAHFAQEKRHISLTLESFDPNHPHTLREEKNLPDYLENHKFVVHKVERVRMPLPELPDYTTSSNTSNAYDTVKRLQQNKALYEAL